MNFVDHLNPYAWVMHLRRWLYQLGILKSYSIDLPVISVGNLSTGGTGKTPMVIFLARLIKEKKIGVVLRGYKRQSVGLLVVSDGKNILASVSQSGDEAQLYCNELPEAIIICDEDRVRGAAKAKELGAEIILLDDGFQHLRIKRDLNILLVNANEGFPPVIPFGKGREMRSAAKDSDCIIVTNSPVVSTELSSQLEKHTGKPVFRSSVEFAMFRELSPNKIETLGEELSGATVAAVSGIGYPQGFEQLLARHVKQIEPYRLGDHAEYTSATLSKIIAVAAEHQCDAIVTTTKDAVKLQPLLDHDYNRNSVPVYCMSSSISLESPGVDFLKTQLQLIIERQ